MAKGIGEKILEEANPTKDIDVLDYGCGTGLLGLFLLPHVRACPGCFNEVDEPFVGAFENPQGVSCPFCGRVMRPAKQR